MFVSMIDNFMSGWGEARDKTNIYLVECDDIDQAEMIERAAHKRSEMSKVKIHQDRPYYCSKQYLVTDKHFDDLGGVWKEEDDD